MDARTLRELAWLLAGSADERVRNGAGALMLARRLAPEEDAANLDLLAAALAETGAFAEATGVAERALGEARRAGQSERAAGIDQRLKLYQSGQAYRGVAPD